MGRVKEEPLPEASPEEHPAVDATPEELARAQKHIFIILGVMLLGMILPPLAWWLWGR